jgi:hypothetical protein
MFADPTVDIAITVGGTTVVTVPGTASSAVVPAAMLAEGFNRICVINSSGLPACCIHLTDGINVADLIAGGDGTGSADRNVVGINPDTGVLELAYNNNGVPNTGDNPQAVDPMVSPYIDSVFILDQQMMPISSAGVLFEFGAGDPTGGTYSHIIKDFTHDIDKPIFEIWAGGINTWVSCVGIHASAGIALDLTELRRRHGELATFECFAGMDTCGTGTVTIYAIASDGTEVLDSMRVDALGANTGAAMELDIPEDALYLTLAVGASDSGIGCDHGVYAHARITFPRGPVGPRIVRGDSDSNSLIELTDAIRILGFLFVGGASPLPACFDSADSDDNGQLELTDAVRILGFLFLGLRPPEPPGPSGARYETADCGLDETPDRVAGGDLGCLTESRTCAQ